MVKKKKKPILYYCVTTQNIFKNPWVYTATIIFNGRE